MDKDIRITTADNPYDPFKEWEQWLVFDTNKGYHSCERLALVATVSDQLSDEENFDTVERGIEQLMKYGALNKQGQIIEYKKVIKQKETTNTQ